MRNINSIKRANVGIYIHVPFCLSKCHYCDFCSVQRVSDEKKEFYVSRLCDEITLFAKKIGEGGEIPVADTVYFGGGTPTLLSSEQFGRILSAVERNFGIDPGAEITAETNPKTADRGKLSEMRRLGINRLSIGMQSVHGAELRALGRIHSFDDFKMSFSDAREAGFDNISVDLMYGIPLQTRESFLNSVEVLAALEPEHISSYALSVEEGTSFYRRRESLVLPDEDTVAEMYGDMTESLARFGYRKYEISNFAKEGRESRHNLKYWRLEDYLGFGPAAHSCFAEKRFGHSRDIDAYLGGESIIIDIEELSRRERMNEYVMLGMRLADGISFSDFAAKFGREFLSEFGEFAKYRGEFVKIDANNCRFTEKGMLVSNYILSDVLDFEK